MSSRNALTDGVDSLTANALAAWAAQVSSLLQAATPRIGVLALLADNGIDWVVLSKKDLAKLILKKVPFFKRIFALQAILEIEFVFTIPFEMWMDVMQAQQQMYG